MEQPEVISHGDREQRWNRVCWSLEKASEAEVLLVKARRCLQETCQEEFGRVFPTSCSLAPWVEKIAAQCDLELAEAKNGTLSEETINSKKLENKARSTISELTCDLAQEVNAWSPRPPEIPRDETPMPPAASPRDETRLPSAVDDPSPRVSRSRHSLRSPLVTDCWKFSSGKAPCTLLPGRCISNGNTKPHHKWTLVANLEAEDSAEKLMLDQAVLAAATDDGGAVKRNNSCVTTSSCISRDRARLLRQATGMHLPCSAKAVDKLRSMKIVDDEEEILDIVVVKYLDGWIAIPIFHPQAKVRLVWLIIGCLFMVYEACMIPYHLSFVDKMSFFAFFVSCVINTYFIFDIPFTFMTGYFNSQGNAVMNHRLIASRYVRTWLAIDVVAGIPWEWFQGFDNLQAGSGLKSFRFFRLTPLLRLTKLLRLMKLKTVLDMFETFIESHHWVIVLTGVFKVTASTFMIMHWAACCWHGIGKSSDQSWMGALAEGMLPTTDSDWYALSLYFTMTTMTTVGYGDIHPMNLEECRFALLLLPVSSVLFAMLMGTLTDLIFSLNYHGRERAEKKYRLVRYMNWRAVPSRLTMRIRQHLLFIWDTKEGYDTYEEELKTELPPLLRAELSYHLYGRILNNQPFLTWMRDYPICTKMLATKVHLHYFGTGDHLFRQGDPNAQIFMVLTGLVWLSLGQNLHEGQEAFSATKDLRHVRSGCCSCSFVGRGRQRIHPVEEKGMRSFGPEEPLTIPTKRVSFSRPPDVPLAYSPNNCDEDESKGKSFRCCFNSQVLNVARINMRHHDEVKLQCVIRLQRIWRAKKSFEKVAAYSSKSGLSGKTKVPSSPSASPSKGRSDRAVVASSLALHRMQSHMVTGPAYFGESCLWKKFEEWDVGQTSRYTYTARCESRIEVLRLERKDVQAVIEHYSPWLPERFNIFCEAVCEELARYEEDHSSPRKSFGMETPAICEPLRHVAYASEG